MTLYALYRSAARFALTIGKKPQIIYTCTRNVGERRSHPRPRPTTIRNPQSQTTTNFREFLDAENEDESEGLDLADVVGRDEQRQWKEFLTNVDLRDPDIIKDLYMFEKSQRSKLKRQIVRRKHFKRKKEISVLTWQAKEQIRFLNQEYPEEWTVDKLTESFPVSRFGVLDVLKSSYIPRDEKEIKKHDIKALRNIQDIKERLENESQSMDPDEKESLEDQIEKIGNASGIKSLPLTQLVTRRSIAAQSKLLRPSNKIGPFQSMLMYYDRIVNGDQQIQDQKYAILSENTEKENERIDDGKSRGAKPIENLIDQPYSTKTENSGIRKQLYSDTSGRFNSHQTDNIERLDSPTNDKIYDNYEMHENESSTSRRTNKKMNNFEMQEEQRFSASSMHENGRSTSCRTSKNINNFVLHKDRVLLSPENKKNMNNFEMQEEQRFSASFKNERSIESSRRHRMDGLNKRKDIFTSTSQVTNSNNNKLNAVQNENFDFIPEDGQKIQKWNTEPEMYTSDTFGKTVTMQKAYIEISGRHSEKFNEGLVEQIKVPKRHKASFYKKGKIMYDDKGDFLYKIP